VFEKSYLMNPFMLMTSSTEELAREINNLASRYNYQDDTQGIISDNICLESDILMIYGELIARYQKDAEMLKLEADILEKKSTYQLRKDWVATSNEKVPAMSYFEAQGTEIAKSLWERQIDAKSMLDRFKMAYKSMETKQNALKKKQDAMKYEDYQNGQ